MGISIKENSFWWRLLARLMAAVFVTINFAFLGLVLFPSDEGPEKYQYIYESKIDLSNRWSLEQIEWAAKASARMRRGPVRL